jgi:hypothetical protein
MKTYKYTEKYRDSLSVLKVPGCSQCAIIISFLNP